MPPTNSTAPTHDAWLAVFLDRDGTIIEDVGYPHRPEDLKLLPNAVDGLREMAALGFQLVIVTNQSGVARGYFTEEAAWDFHQLLVQQLAEQGITIRATYMCPFHPTEGVGAYRLDSPQRKPYPGMLLQAAVDLGLDLSRCYMIGDKSSDVEAGRRAACRTIRIGNSSADSVTEENEADNVVPDLVAAAAAIRAGNSQHPGAEAAHA